MTGMLTPQFKGVGATPTKWSVMCELVQHGNFQIRDRASYQALSLSSCVTVGKSVNLYLLQHL